MINWYKKMPSKFLLKSDNPNKHVHGLSIPMRMLIVGGSGAGKTQTLLNLIHAFGKTFQNIHIITRNADEPLYNYLKEKCKEIEITEGMESLPDLDKMDKEEQSLVVLDDLILEKNQTRICEFFVRARKLNVSVVYLSQSYYAVPKIIRQNLTYIIVKRLNTLPDLFRILREYSLGVDKKQLKAIYDDCVSENRQNFLLIDLEADPEARLRKNFDGVYDLS
jgi:Tfp pilus assembly ATPase PilU